MEDKRIAEFFDMFLNSDCNKRLPARVCSAAHYIQGQRFTSPEASIALSIIKERDYIEIERVRNHENFLGITEYGQEFLIKHGYHPKK